MGITAIICTDILTNYEAKTCGSCMNHDFKRRKHGPTARCGLCGGRGSWHRVNQECFKCELALSGETGIGARTPHTGPR